MTTPSTAPSSSKKAFSFQRDSVYMVDPNEVCIIGGAAILPDAERGPLDTGHKEGEHELWDQRLRDVMTEAEVLNTDAFGVIEGITIRKEGDLAVVIDGRRRVRRARVVNARRIASGQMPIKIKASVSKSKDAMGVMISANEIRQEDSPLVKLEKLKAYMGRGASVADTAVAFGLSPEYVAQLVAFDETCTDEVKAALNDGQLSLRAAAELARIKDPDKQREALAGYRTIVASGEASKGKRVGTLRAAQAARAQAEGKPEPKAGGKAGKPSKGKQAAAGAKADGKPEKAAPTSQGGLIPTRREMSGLLRELGERTEVENEAAVLLDDARGGAKKPTIKGQTIDLSHIEGAWAIGVAEGLRLALGKCEDKELLKLLAKAARA